MSRVLASALILVLSTPALAQDWPMWRHDAQRTAFQPTPLGVTVPVDAWTAQVGGRLGADQLRLADVDGDGELDVLVVAGGHVEAVRGRGGVLWATSVLSVGDFVGLADVDGDGVSEVVARGTASGVFILRLRTGAVEWQWVPEPGVRVGHPLLADADGDGASELYVPDDGCSRSGQGTGRLFDFNGTFAAEPTVVDLLSSDVDYWCGRSEIIADVSGDGIPELLLPSDSRLHVFSLQTGAELGVSDAVDAWPWGLASLWVGDLDADGAAEVVVATNFRAGIIADCRRITVFDVDHSSPVARWTRAFPCDGNHVFGSPIAVELDSDVLGLEIATSFFDSAAGRWITEVIPGTSLDGAPVVSLAGRYVCGVSSASAVADGSLLLCGATNARPPAFSQVDLIRFAGIDMTADSVELLARGGPPEEGGQCPQLGNADEGWRSLVLADDGADGRPDRVVAVEASGGTIVAESHLLPDVDVVAVGAVQAPDPSAWVSWTDGSVGVYDSSLDLQNADPVAPTSPGARVRSFVVPVVSLACWGDAEGKLVAFRDASRRLIAYRFPPSASAASPSLAWSSEGWSRDAGAVIFFGGTGDSPGLFYHEAVGGTSPEELRIAYFDGRPSPPATDVGSDPFSYFSPGGLLWPGDGGPSTTYLTIAGTMTSNVSDTLALRLSDGGTVWSVTEPSGGSLGLTLTTDGLGSLSIAQVSAYRLRTVVPATGEVAAQATETTLLGTVTAVDVLAGPGLELLVSASYDAGPALFASDLARVWRDSTPGVFREAAVVAGTDPPTLLSVRAEASSWQLLDARSGAVLGTGVLAGGEAFASEAAARAADARLGSLSAPIAVAAAPSGGPPVYVLGSTDGFLYALSGIDGALLWRVGLRSAVGSPIACDVDSDGGSEIVVGAGDGLLHVIDDGRLASPDAVYDTDGSFLATGDDDELDVLPQPSRYGANWTPADGATDYEFSIVRDDEFVVLPWTRTDGRTAGSSDSLSLQLGERYYIAVRGFGGPGGSLVSAQVRSDGIVVTDLSPPIVHLSTDTPRLFTGGVAEPGAVIVNVDAQDEFVLALVRVLVRSSDGSIDFALGEAAPGLREYSTVIAWPGLDRRSGEPVPAGEYLLVAEALDDAGHLGQDSMTIHVCDAVTEEGPCASSVAPDGGDGGSDVGLDTTGDEGPDVAADASDFGGDSEPRDPGWGAGGTGCACSADGRPSGLWLGVPAMALSGLRRRRQRARVGR